MRDNKGQGLTEYALIMLLVALVAVAAVTLVGTQLQSLWTVLANSLP